MREEKGEETLKPLLTACRQDRKAQEGGKGGGVGWGIKSSNGQTQNMRQMEKMKLNP